MCFQCFGYFSFYACRLRGSFFLGCVGLCFYIKFLCLPVLGCFHSIVCFRFFFFFFFVSIVCELMP